MSHLDNDLRASIAAEMLWPKDEPRDTTSFQRLRDHLRNLRERVVAEELEMEEAQRGLADWQRHQSDQEESRT